MATPLVLASSSPFRRELLQRLGLNFSTDTPDIDEQALDGETPATLVQRLATEKAQSVAKKHPQALIIGSDQVACIDSGILGKPGNRKNAIAQLMAASGKTVTFYTGLCLFNSATQNSQVLCEPFQVTFRHLNEEQVTRYVDKEQPFNCAGSFKSEGLGVSLFERLNGDDPNSLIGLPLIQLIRFLANEGIMLP
jgi:septum formation protein